MDDVGVKPPLPLFSFIIDQVWKEELETLDGFHYFRDHQLLKGSRDIFA
jgi:hypothetical protein